MRYNNLALSNSLEIDNSFLTVAIYFTDMLYNKLIYPEKFFINDLTVCLLCIAFSIASSDDENYSISNYSERS